jgi:Lon protease-like protein
MATQQLTIPMFPLNMVLLPGETKTLHIFEERYKQLVSDCLLTKHILEFHLFIKRLWVSMV